jgi:pimeloyl-ACP methyl ester carboxylesterase
MLSACAGERVVEQARVTGSLESKWCTLGSTRVHYLDVDPNGSEAALLIVHGYLGSTVSFLELIDVLSWDLRVVMPDLPPFGASGTPDCSITMDYYMDFLVSFTREVGVDVCYLMGTSIGANIAAHYTAAHPQQVQGLVFLSPFGLKDQAGRMSRIQRWDSFLPLASSLVGRKVVKRRLHRAIIKDECVTPELVSAYMNPFTTAEGRRATVEFTRRIVGRCWMDEVLPQIGHPVLILSGSEDKLLGAEERERFRRLLTSEQLEVIPDSGHFLYLDSPDVVSEKIVDFTRGGTESCSDSL